MLSRVMLRLTMHDGVSTVGSHCDWSPRGGLSRGLRESNLIWSWREGLGGVVFINRILCQLWISCPPHYFWILGNEILRWLDFISRNFLRRVLLFKGSLRLHHCDREPLRLAYCSCRCLLLNIVGTVHGKIYHCWAKVWFLSGYWRQGLRLGVFLNLNFQPLGSCSYWFLEKVVLLPVDFGNLCLRRETTLVSTLLVNPNVGKRFLALLFRLRTGLGSLLGLRPLDASIRILNFLSRRKVYLQNLGWEFIIGGALLFLLRFLKLPR